MVAHCKSAWEFNMKIIKRRVHDFSVRKIRMPAWNRSMPKPMPSSNPSGRILSSFGKLRQHRIMGQGDSAWDFDPSESMENAEILDVFPIFHTARLGQKIRRSPQLPLCGVALNSMWTLPARILNRRSSTHLQNRNRESDSFILSEKGSKHNFNGQHLQFYGCCPFFCFVGIVKHLCW